MTCDLPTYLRRSGGIGWTLQGTIHFAPTISLLSPLAGGCLPWLRPLGSVFGAATTTFCNSITVQRTTDDVIAHARQILYAPTTNEYDGVLLQIMPFTWDVSSHFHPVTQPNAGDLAHCRVRLLGRHGTHLRAHAALLRRPTQG